MWRTRWATGYLTQVWIVLRSGSHWLTFSQNKIKTKKSLSLASVWVETFSPICFRSLTDRSKPLSCQIQLWIFLPFTIHLSSHSAAFTIGGSRRTTKCTWLGQGLWTRSAITTTHWLIATATLMSSGKPPRKLSSWSESSCRSCWTRSRMISQRSLSMPRELNICTCWKRLPCL